ncbi:lethal(3)malignant brain tumor-like protein 4 [Platysternon megacephalum]|uniref:Lethal(3)malignant brain tumor-like protein 4 n=1 Tax=Platysternon megacephalum TaxID=55544 RepID=A0A4D9ESK0_9SAUR|nr:lethal(3)malignant brain tumor-like protein 4 [Platysternon megacephalum]
MSLPAAWGAGPDELIFYVNGRKIVEKNADPEQMLLSYLRKRHILSLLMQLGHYLADCIQEKLPLMIIRALPD